MIYTAGRQNRHTKIPVPAANTIHICRRYLEAGRNYPEGWYPGIIAHVREMANCKACHIVYDIDSAEPSWEKDYVFRQNKASKEWTILDERVDRNWNLIQPPPDKDKKPSGGKRKRPAAGTSGLSLSNLGHTPTPLGSSVFSSELGSYDLPPSRFDAKAGNDVRSPNTTTIEVQGSVEC